MNTRKRLKQFLAVGISLFSITAFSKKPCDAILEPIKGDVSLPGECVYSKGLRIFEGNTRLNCNGAVLDGGNEDTIGLLIDSQGRPMEQVHVENCVFKNFKSMGVKITWTAPDRKKGSDKEQIYRRTPSNVVLNNLKIQSIRREGIYVDDYVRKVTIKDSEIERTGSTAIYLEHSSRDNVIVNNIFRANGFDAAGVARREAIAVDSSAYNRISGNKFESNGLGGIFLYKNCGEHISSGKQVLRWQGSNFNEISDNTFVNEKVGVWIASRQSKDLSALSCGDQPMDSQGRYFQDFADENRILNNEFCGGTVGIRIEGDKNVFEGNRFGGRTIPVEIPTTQRELLKNRPPFGNKIARPLSAQCVK